MSRSHSPWQPLTFRGVAAFSAAPPARLLLAQSVVAVLAAAAVVWLLAKDWFPVVRAAIRQLPGGSEIRDGRLAWSGPSPRMLAENSFLAVTVDLKHEGRARSPAHLQIELGETDIRLMSLLGWTKLGYPKEWRLTLSRRPLEAQWGAWQPASLAGAGVSLCVVLLLVWGALALGYMLPVRLLAFFADRAVSSEGSWRLAAASLLPGAMVFTAALALYSMGTLDFVGLLLALAAHIAIGWVYLVGSTLALPRDLPDRGRHGNPFAMAAESGRSDGSAPSNKSDKISSLSSLQSAGESG